MTLRCAARCRYVKDKDACGADDQYIPYLQLIYCASGNLWLLASVFLVVWLLLLFYAMSVVAEVFLCPAVQVGTWSGVSSALACSKQGGVQSAPGLRLHAHVKRPRSKAVLRCLGSLFALLAWHSTSRSGCSCRPTSQASRYWPLPAVPLTSSRRSPPSMVVRVSRI